MGLSATDAYGQASAGDNGPMRHSGPNCHLFSEPRGSS